MRAWKWLAYFTAAALIAACALTLASLLAGCSSIPPFSWFASSPPPPKADPLTAPWDYAKGILRMIVQWGIVLGILCIFPRPRSILGPMISWLWRAPAGKVSVREAASDVLLAAPRLVGLVHAKPPKPKSEAIACE